ncbi:endo alpha-1,4 polygalactosaminidase [Labrys sp. KNU-23]|uniref:endo alpha-1,4 polygalactosaminidase n=1 Tax=Labrys sp. KNU-23 TaxID=2789216 RepID=UPI00165A2CAB|nr:endo alpha-1,4 polygalactosaminidase [Labrys sp. KNU-23]
MKRKIKSTAIVALSLIVISPALAQQDKLAPEVMDRIPKAQIFNNRMASPTNLPDVGFVWGAKTPLRSSSVVDSFYYPNQRDLNRTHTADWYKANQPSWITYQCDRQTPSYGYTYAWGAYAPLDTSNPDVRQYLLKTYIEPALAKGYRAIAFDNVALPNTDKRCGVWHDGKWVQLFSGQSRDPAYTAQKLDYIGWFAKEIHQRGGQIALNAKVDPYQPAQTKALIDLADIWVDEGGFSDSCNHRVVDNIWHLKRDLIQSRGNRAFVSINYTCMTSPTPPDNAELSWIVASFLVNRNNRSYLAVLSHKDSGRWVAYPNLDPPVGAPSEASQLRGTLAWRNYQKGYVIVNFSGSESTTVQPPPGNWHDMFGQSISGSIELKPRSGLVLLRTQEYIHGWKHS